LKHLVCPYTKEDLDLRNAVYGENGEIKSGVLVSKKSKNQYKIVDYIPVMLKGYGTKEFNKAMRRYEGWAFQWKNKKFEFNTYEGDIGVDKEHIVNEYNLDNMDLKGKDVFEAGCGGGRLTSVLHRSEVRNYFAVDISEAVYECRRKHSKRENIHFIRGDIANPPFRIQSIDFVFNIAVLQHTKEPQKTLYGMSSVLKIGGFLATSHYMWPKNPFVRLKVIVVEIIRAFIRWLHIPKSLVMAFTYLSVLGYKYWIFRPLVWIFFHVPPVKDLNDKVVWQNNYDTYNPATYQAWNSESDMQRMLLKAGLTPILEGRVFDNAYVCKKMI
jgi:2-polyprenyl-3-methyl-5-hydroxy-6-metoxy-1,4-benzoquinol methylase/uncharacterized protein YbaR (Trm112 family)